MAKYCSNCGECVERWTEPEPTKVSKAPKRVDSLPKVKDSEPEEVEESETVKVIYKKKPISEKQKAHLEKAREKSKQKAVAKKVKEPEPELQPCNFLF
jgi:hypothetical protein